VAQTINGVTTYFIGNYYELTGSQVTKYYGVYPEPVEGPERLASPHLPLAQVQVCANPPSPNP